MKKSMQKKSRDLTRPLATLSNLFRPTDTFSKWRREKDFIHFLERGKWKKYLFAASLKKLALSWLKPSKLAPASLKQDCFKRQLHLFFGSPDEVARKRTVCDP